VLGLHWQYISCETAAVYWIIVAHDLPRNEEQRVRRIAPTETQANTGKFPQIAKAQTGLGSRGTCLPL